MDIRQFNLVNDAGETYRLTLSNRYGAAFFHDVTNLGSEESAQYQQIGNIFGKLSTRISQKSIQGVIKFTQPRAYENYKKFVLFCQHKPLKIYYRTPSGEYWRDGEVTKIDKSENADVLQASIQFTAASLWYQPFILEGIDRVDILSDSVNESGCHISIQGVFEEPQWEQQIDGAVIRQGKLENKTENGATISAAIQSGETLHIRTDTIPYKIYKTNPMGVITDMYRNSKWDTERFCLIGYGHNVIRANNAINIKVEGRLEYETI